MKPISDRVRLALLATMAFCLVEGAFLTGCGTNAPTKAAQADQILITTVNAGMKEWASYVNSGKATQSQINMVHVAYDAYYTAQQAAKAAIEKGIVSLTTTNAITSQADMATANQAVTDAETALLAILNKYLLK